MNGISPESALISRVNSTVWGYGMLCGLPLESIGASAGQPFFYQLDCEVALNAKNVHNAPSSSITANRYKIGRAH